MGKMIVLTFKDSEEIVFQRAVSLLADELQIEQRNCLFPRLYCPFMDWKYGNISAGCYGIGERYALPVLSMVRLSFLHPVQTGYSRSRKYLKLFGVWKAIAVIQALQM